MHFHPVSRIIGYAAIMALTVLGLTPHMSSGSTLHSTTSAQAAVANPVVYLPIIGNGPTPIATDIPGTPLEIGTTVRSVLDVDTRRREVYAVSLRAGQTLRIVTSSSQDIYVYIAKPGQKSFADSGEVLLCRVVTSCSTTFVAAVDGTYHIAVVTDDTGVRYTLTTRIDSEIPAPPVARDIPGTPLEIGTTVRSVLDVDTRRREVYAVSLRAGQTLRIVTSSSQDIYVYIAKPGQKSFADSGEVLLCRVVTSCSTTFVAAVDGTYHIAVVTDDTGVRYTLTTRIDSEIPAPPVARDIPGTPLEIGTTVRSVLDVDTRRREVYAVSLRAGQTLRIVTSSSQDIYVYIAKPGQKSFADSGEVLLCRVVTSCSTTFVAAVDGTYHIAVVTDDTGVRYTLSTRLE